MFVERFAKLLNHLVELVGLASAERFRDKGFNSVGQAAIGGGHTYLLSKVKHISLRCGSEKESSLVPETGIEMVSSTGSGEIFSLIGGGSRLGTMHTENQAAGVYCLKTNAGPLTRLPFRSTVTSTRSAILMKGIPLFIP